MSEPRLHIAFVCRYNRARSVMAAVMFSEQLRRNGLGDAVRVSSAGTGAVVGVPADPRAVQVLAERGYPAPTAHRAALVVALGYEHVGLLQRRGVDDERIRYGEVKNPCWGHDFADAFDRIDAAMPSLHALVDNHFVSRRLDTAVGWRFGLRSRETQCCGRRACRASCGRGRPRRSALARRMCRRGPTVRVVSMRI